MRSYDMVVGLESALPPYLPACLPVSPDGVGLPCDELTGDGGEYSIIVLVVVVVRVAGKEKSESIN